MGVQLPAKNTEDAYAPFRELFAVTPSDSTTYDPPLRGIICTVAGNVAVKTAANTTAVTIAVLQGQLIPALITLVMSTNTTATVVGGR